LFDVVEISLGTIIVVLEAMIEFPTFRHVCDCEANFLKRDSPVIVVTQYLDARPLECTKQATSVSKLIVFAMPIIIAIPALWLR
jgi:hypothetical protein